MELHVICGYPSKSQGTYDNFNNADFTAAKFIKAIKGKAFRGYATIKQGGVDYRFENDNQGRLTAMGIAGRGIAGLIYNNFHIEAACIVPVPASDHTALGCDFTGARIAAAIQQTHAGYRACPNLTFTQVMQKATEGGSRDPDELTPYLRLHEGLPQQQPIIIVDDVTSTHGHLKAVARILRAAGLDVRGACCVAQTVWSRPESMFGIPAKDLNIDTWPHDDPQFF